MKDKIKLVPAWPSQIECESLVTFIPTNMEPKDILNEELYECAGDEFERYILEEVLEPKVGDVVAVPSFDLPVQHVFVGFARVWRTDFDRQDKTLLDICRNAFALAKGMGVRQIAFPLLCGGKNGFPKKKAARLMMQAILECLDDSIDEVLIVDKDPDVLGLFQDRLAA